jgi:hypothetical protein
MSYRVCSIVGCGVATEARGYCEKHYARLRKHGDPLVVTRVVGENRTKNPLYKAYHAMLDRCKNPNNTAYAYYGGRGIKVCKRWQGTQGFSNFLEDVGEKPKNLTLERRDNNKGYNPKNCYWADRSQQQYNQRISVTNTSGHKGVSLYKATGRWSAYLHINKKRVHLGYYKTIKEAVKARKQAEVKLKEEIWLN